MHEQPQIVLEQAAPAEIVQEFARYLPQIGTMSEQLQQTSKQIEDAVVGVCDSFQGIAARAQTTVAKATGFLSQDAQSSVADKSFEGLIEACSETLVKIMDTTAEAGEISRRAIERIEQIDHASQQISHSLGQLDEIARGNRMLAFNARIEAAHAGDEGMGFAVVAVELATQTSKSMMVTAHVGELASNLRGLAESTLMDLRRMNEQDNERIQQCRQQVEQSLRDLQATHSEMAVMFNSMTEEGALLAADISAAIRGLQFQDRANQRIGHVVSDLDTMYARLSRHADHLRHVAPKDDLADERLGVYSMQEEREAAGLESIEASPGDIELF